MGVRHNLYKSFDYAFQGLFTAFRKEPNLKIHIVFAFSALTAGFLLQISRIEWLILTMAIVLVLILELMNTMFEALVDLVSPDLKPAAKTAKDVSASVVLLAAIFSVIVGILLFGPKILILATRLSLQ